MKNAEARYTELASIRQAFLDRARECSKLTIPSLLPPDGHNGTQPLPTPFQSVGARGLNNLAARTLLALLPPNSPFFKLTVDDFVLSEITGRKDVRGDIEKALSSIERAVQNEVETTAIRVPAFEAMKHLFNDGNVLIQFPRDGGMRVFAMDRYVVKRDPMGTPLEIIVKESVSPLVLSPAIRERIAREGNKEDPNNTVDLYTYIGRRPDKWVIWQEVKGIRLPDSFGTYPLDRVPWLPLRYTRIDGEDYGRGYVEEYLGDLMSLEGLMQAIVEGSAAAAKVLFLVKPNATTRARTLARLPNGGIGEGDANEVTTLQMQKFNDFRVAFDTVTRIEQRLEYAFLLTSAIQRNGERVTAEEIRKMASDLEVALGGVYALLSQEFQLPLVNIIMARMTAQKRLPKLPKDKIRPSIVTGLEALGRGNDRTRIAAFMADIAPFKEIVASRLNVDELLKRLATANQLDADGLILSEEQIAQEQQRQQAMSMVQGVAPNIVNQGGAVVKQMMQQTHEAGMAAQPAPTGGPSGS